MIAAAALALLAAIPAFEVRDCPGSLAGRARCGIVRVPEDRTRANGRTIPLNVVIVPASARRRLPTLFDLDGGPGLPSTKNAGFYLSDGAAYRAERDVVLFDQRGTGASNPLTCQELATPDIQYQPLYPADRVQSCRRRLSAGADLTQYGTDAAAADLDSVRQALGDARIDIVALSYGTTLALRYMTLYPQRTRAAVLFGVVPPSARPPRSHATAAQGAFDALLAACAVEAACAAAFPDPRGDLRGALAGLPASLSPEVFLEKIRSLMYQPSTARAVPMILHRAAAGDLAPFYARTRRTRPDVGSDGVYLSITCSESLAAMDFDEAAAVSRATLFGDYRLRRQRDACAAWPHYRVAPGFFDPPAPSTPMLIISGALDPVTPRAWAEALARGARHARHIVLAGSGHVMDGMEGIDTCLDPLIVAFLDRGDPDELDLACVATMHPLPFETAAPAP